MLGVVSLLSMVLKTSAHQFVNQRALLCYRQFVWLVGSVRARARVCECSLVGFSPDIV